MYILDKETGVWGSNSIINIQILVGTVQNILQSLSYQVLCMNLKIKYYTFVSYCFLPYLVSTIIFE